MRQVAAVLTVRDVAALLQVSTATVYAMIERGELSSFRVLNSIRVRREDFEAFTNAVLTKEQSP